MNETPSDALTLQRLADWPRTEVESFSRAISRCSSKVTQLRACLHRLLVRAASRLGHTGRLVRPALPSRPPLVTYFYTVSAPHLADQARSLRRRLFANGFICTVFLASQAQGKEPTCQCKRHGFNLRVGKSPWRKETRLAPAFFPGRSPRQFMGVAESRADDPEKTRMPFIDSTSR